MPSSPNSRPVSADPQTALGQALRDWFDGLAGEWRIVRTVSDGSTFDGVTIFVCHGQAYHQVERGQLTLPSGKTLQASRQWIWRLAGEALVEISYPPQQGGGQYHEISARPAISGWYGTATHLCGDDRYKAGYRFDRDRVEVWHDVSGPNKSYRMITIIRR